MGDSGPVEQFGRAGSHPKYVTIKGECRVDALDGNAQVGNSGIHDGDI
jgi:hypothetical protein